MGQTFEHTSAVPAAKPFTIGPIKNNRWVMCEGKVGIVTKLSKEGAFFNAVGENGITYMSRFVDPFSLVLASWEQIPVIRRPTLERAYELGYAIPQD